MSNKSEEKMKRAIIAIVAVVAFTALIGFMISMNHGDNVDHIYAASADSGDIPEKIVGDPETAKVVIYEYADYGCSHCASWNEKINALIEKHPGEIALVYRGFQLGFQNGYTVSVAATAAQLQGYWKEYKDLLFKNQAEWSYATSAEVSQLLVDYFVAASKEKGDVDKFKSDMSSEAVDKRVNFENTIGVRAGIKGTPTFRINGKEEKLGALEEKIENLLK